MVPVVTLHLLSYVYIAVITLFCGFNILVDVVTNDCIIGNVFETVVEQSYDSFIQSTGQTLPRYNY